MMKFINRDEELNFLERKYASKEAELIILYGRRRIGKTELIFNFIKNKKAIYFLGRLESRAETLKRFNNTLMEFFKDMELARRPLRSWDEIFDYLGEKIKNKLVVIFDEFPFIVEKFPEIVSILQDKWDSKLRKTNAYFVRFINRNDGKARTLLQIPALR